MPLYNSFITSILIAILSALGFLVNHYFYHFTGNNYFPTEAYLGGLYLVIIYLGVKLLFPTHRYLNLLVKYLIFFYGTMALIALYTNIIQLTPFTPIDPFLLKLDLHLNINTEKIVNWTYQHSFFQQLLAFIYDTLPYQLGIIPILLAVAGEFKQLDEFFYLLLMSALIGFSIYYFFPTTAPASVVSSPFFTPEQKATGLKFAEIHQHLSPSTIQGGLIAFPSFHAIWACLCVYLVRKWVILSLILGLFNSLLIISCVLLGWHYFTDIIGSLMIILTSYVIYTSRQ